MNTSKIQCYALSAAKIVGVFIALAVLVHVSWNMFAPDMFGLDAIRMKEALGLTGFVATFGWLLNAGRHGGYRKSTS